MFRVHPILIAKALRGEGFGNKLNCCDAQWARADVE
jgi:hypothetical protein